MLSLTFVVFAHVGRHRDGRFAVWKEHRQLVIRPFSYSFDTCVAIFFNDLFKHQLSNEKKKRNEGVHNVEFLAFKSSPSSSTTYPNWGAAFALKTGGFAMTGTTCVGLNWDKGYGAFNWYFAYLFVSNTGEQFVQRETKTFFLTSKEAKKWKRKNK